MRSKFTLLTATAVALPLGLGAWSAEAANIYETLQERDEFSKFVEAIEAADLQETLENEGPFTVFAPTDEAFEEFPQEVRDAFLGEDYRDQLESLVRMHIVENQELTAEVLRENETLRPEVITMEGEILSLDFDNDDVIVRLAAAPPAIEPVDPAVTPVDPTIEPADPADPAAAAEPVTPEVTEAPTVAEPVTPEVAEAPEVVQPFEEEYERIGARFEATVVEPDIEVDNGVIHAIDAVLVPHPVAQEMADLELDDEAEE